MNAITGQYCVNTKITRAGTEYDAIVHFDVARYYPGCDACYYQRNGDPGWPAEPAEFDLAFRGAELDGDDEGEPLTATEIAALAEWLDTDGHDKACDAACDYVADREADHADRLYDEWKDQWMEERP